MLVSNTNSVFKKTYTERTDGMSSSQKALFHKGRLAFDRLTPHAIPQGFQFMDMRNFQYNINPVEVLNAAQNVLNVSKTGGKITSFDLETTGGFKALDFKNNLTQGELNMGAITEFALHTQHVGADGKKLGSPVQQNFSFGISSDQLEYYEDFFRRVQNQPMSSLSSSDKSTLERLARYRAKDAFTLNMDGVYELNGIADSVIDIAASRQGYDNLVEVGRNQGLNTKRGRQLFQNAINALQSADSVSGYNIKNFDLPVLNEIATRYGLKSHNLNSEKIYDVMTSLRATMQGLGFSELHKMAQHFGIENFNPSRPGSLEDLASAVGKQLQAHYATADAGVTAEIGVFEKVFGDTFNKTLPEITVEKMAKTVSPKNSLFLTNDSMAHQVIYANRSLRGDVNGFDFLKMGSERQDNMEWVVNRGEYYKTGGVSFITKDQLATELGLREAEKVLDYYGNSEGVYSMTLSGASKHNSVRSVNLYRGQVDDFQGLFAGNFTVANKVKSNQSVMGVYDVTQSMIDHSTELAFEDRARRDIMSSLKNDGNYDYDGLKKLYRMFDSAEKRFDELGIKMTKDNFKKALNGEIKGFDVNQIAKSNGVVTAQRRLMAGHAYGFLKNSKEFMLETIEQIESSITENTVRGLVTDESQLQSVLKTTRQIAFTKVFDDFEIGSNTRAMTEQGAYTVSIPKLDANGKITKEKSSLNVMRVSDGTSQLTNAINKIETQQGKVRALKNVVGDLESRGLLPRGSIVVNSNAPVYNVAQSISAQLNQQITGLMGNEALGLKQAIKSNSPINMLSVMNKLDYSDQVDIAGNQLSFAYAYLSEQGAGAEQVSMDTFKVRLKNPKNKTQEKFAGIGSYFKTNRLDRPSIVQSAVEYAYQNIGVTADKSNFGVIEDVLMNRYGYSKSNVKTIHNTMFNQKSGMVSVYDYDVRMFERDGQLYFGATDQKHSRRFGTAIMNGKQVDDLKTMGLVVKMPMIDQSLGVNTIKTGSVHKAIVKDLNVYVDKKKVSEGIEANKALRISVEDTVDEALKFWIIGNQSVRRQLDKGDLAKANSVINHFVSRAISNAPSLTANQTYVDMVDGKKVIRHGVIPNVNDLMSNNLVNYDKLYNLLPMIYNNDKDVFDFVNEKIMEQEFVTVDKAIAKMGKWNSDLQNGKLYSLSGSGGDIYLKETFMKLMRHDKNLLAKAVQYGAETMDAESLGILNFFAHNENISQVLTESKTKGAYLSLDNPIAYQAHGSISDIARANQNAGFNSIQYNPASFNSSESARLKGAGVTLGKAIMTDKDFNLAQSRTDGAESHITGKLKTMHSHEAIRAVNEVRMNHFNDILNKFGNEYTRKDLKTVLDAFEFNANTYEQRLIMHPALRDTVWNLPELIGFKIDGVDEEQLDKLIGKQLETGDVIGTFDVAGESKQIKYDKQVAGKVVSRDGNTIRVIPTQRQVLSTKVSIGGLEKGMANAVDFGEAENQRLSKLIDEVWSLAYKDAVIIGNPEMGKHMAGGLTIGRYVNVPAMASAGNEVMEEKFLSVFNKHLPTWNGRFVTQNNGLRTFVMDGNPEKKSGNVEGYSKLNAAINELAQEDKDFDVMRQAIESAYRNEEYLTTIAKTTNSDQHPANAVKVQRRGRQILGTAGVEGFGEYKNGVFQAYGKTIADHEDKFLSESDTYQEGKRMAESIRTTLKSMFMDGDAAELESKTAHYKFEDLPLPKGAMIAEDMNETFFGVIGSKYGDKFAGMETIKIDLGNVSVYNPMSEQMENFIYIPKVMTQAVDGKVFFNQSNKGIADLLNAIDVLKSQKSDITYKQAQANVNNAYTAMVGQFFDEFVEKDGIVNSMVAEGRIPFSARGLGSNIYAPVLSGMVTGEVDGVSVTAGQVADEAIKELQNGALDGKAERKYFDFYDKYTYRNAAKVQSDGSMKLYDVVHTSRKQFERMGIDFTDVGKQVLEQGHYKTKAEYDQFIDLLKSKEILDSKGDFKIEATQEQVDNVLKELLAKKESRYEAGNVWLTDKEKALAVTLANKRASFEEIGLTYAREIGVYGTNARDPLFLSTSKNIVKIHLDDRVTDDSWHIFSWLGKKLNQDTDGDSTSMTLLVDRAKNGKAKLLGSNSRVIEAAEKLHEAQADMNKKRFIEDSIDGYMLNKDKTGRVDVENGTVGDDIEGYMRRLKETGVAVDENGKLLDNMIRNEEMNIRAIKNRQNKDAIGYLSIPNFGIREAAKSVFTGVEDAQDFSKIFYFTDISEQKILDTKHVRDGGQEVTSVTKYRNGVRVLFSEDAMTKPEIKEKAVQQIIESFVGPIFSKEGFSLTASDVIGNEALADLMVGASDAEVQAAESIRSLVKLSENQQSLDIMNNPFFKSRASWSDERKINELKKALNGEYAETSSDDLNLKLGLLKGDNVLQLGDGQAISSSDIFVHSKGKYGVDAYRYKGENGVTRQGMFYATMESMTSDGQIKVYAESAEALGQLISNDFTKAESGSLEDLMSGMKHNFADTFQDRAMENYESFMKHKIEAEVVNELLYNNGKASIMDVEDMIRQKVTANSSGTSVESMVQSIFNDVRSYGQLEREVIADLHQSYFDTVQGRETEKFARTVEYMAGKFQVRKSDVSAMIRSFNEDIRAKGRSPRDSKGNVIRNYTSGEMNYVDAQISALERESVATKAFNQLETDDRFLATVRAQNKRIDIDKSYGAIQSEMDRWEAEFASYNGDDVQRMLNSKIKDPTLDNWISYNNEMREQAENSLNTLVNNGSNIDLNWVDSDSVLRALPSMDQSQISELVESLESAVITHGDYAGAMIGELSLEDLRGIMSASAEQTRSANANSINGTRRQIESYFAALDNSADDELLRQIESRATNFDRYILGGEHVSTLKNMNDGIREMAKEARREQRTIEMPDETLSKVQSIFGGNKKLAIGIGAAAVAAAALSGLQFTSSQKNLGAEERDNPYIGNAKTASVSNLQPMTRQAPKSQTTYLNQDHSYNITARSNKNGDYSRSYQSAARVTGSNQVRVVNSDNRNEISPQWLEQQVVELI